MRKMKKLFIVVTAGLLASACVDTMKLPSLPDDAGIVVPGQGGEKYTEVLPRWDEDFLGFSDMTDMFCATDGRFYIADSADGRIHVLRASGMKEESGYEALNNPYIDGKTVKASSVCVDSRFIVFFSDGGDRVYAWNQFLAQTDVVAVVDSLTLIADGDTSMIAPADINFLQATNYKLDVYNNRLDTTALAIDSIAAPFTFYNPSDDLNRQINPTYAAQPKSFRSLAPSESGSNNLFVFVNDHQNNVIVKINFIIDKLVRLKNGMYIFTYKGVFGGNVATPGTGAGTVSNMTGMASDQSGNLYYSQLGDYFGVHKIKAGSYSSVFTLGLNDIMDLDQFSSAMDVAVDKSGNIFVLDSTLNEVKKFDAAGSYVKSLAVTESWVKDGDSLILVTENNVMKRPSVIAAYNDIIYIGDSGNHRILRYTLANDIDIEPPVN